MTGAKIYIGTVVEDVDPEVRGRVKVLCPGIATEPVWALPSLPSGLFAIPNVNDAVLVLSDAPGFYRWSFGAPAREETFPDWAKLQYPNRRALIGKEGDALYGVDAAGVLYVGHFGATEAAVLGNTLKTKLETALQNVENALNTIATATYGGSPMDPASAALVQTAKTNITAVRTTLSAVLSTLVKIAASKEA